MDTNIEAITTAALSMALDAASLRQQVIAANIANAGRADYVARRVSFEAQFADMARGLSDTGGGASASPIELHMRIAPDLAPDGRAHSVQLDEQVGAMAQNTLHYQALLKGLSKHLALMASAVTEGKR
jgi:flagellar basal-body rod protein FlgB